MGHFVRWTGRGGRAGSCRRPGRHDDAPVGATREDDAVSGLEMRPGCECCDVDLPADDVGAVICSLECTFCAGCAEHLERACPNCGGTLMPRPTRVGDALVRHPASTTRVVSRRRAPGPGTPGRVRTDRAAPSGWRRHSRARPHRARGARRAARRGARRHAVDGRGRAAVGRCPCSSRATATGSSCTARRVRARCGTSRPGAPAALSVTVVDGLVVAHTTFDSSANYRSAVDPRRADPAHRRRPHHGARPASPSG